MLRRVLMSLFCLLTLSIGLAGGMPSTARAATPGVVHTWLDGTNWASVALTGAIDLSAAPPSAFTVTDLDTDTAISVTAVSALLTDATTGSSNLLKLTLASEPDITHRLQLKFGASTLSMMPRLVLNDAKYQYTGNDLGATYASDATAFRVWAPIASAVQVLTYTDTQRNGPQKYDMTRSDNGTWYVKAPGDLRNLYYVYHVTNLGHTSEAVDPYAKAVAPNGAFGMVADLAATDPAGWSTDTYRKTGDQVNADIYEVHVRDFSSDPASGMQHHGKYLAFTETGTKGPGGVSSGVDSLKQLGITHVELLPTQGCASVNEIQDAPYNWCYDPAFYNAPNGAYATSAIGTARIAEFKQMVQALHKAGIGVILDVVYNHMASTGSFDGTVPNYFFRQDWFGTPESFFGSAVAAERPMVAKFITDSVLYWEKEYHVDGFRFDAMQILGKNLMQNIATQVRQVNPSAVLLGEGFPTLPPNWQNLYDYHVQDQEMTEGVQKGMHVGIFNFEYRDAIVGSANTPGNPAYATGGTETSGDLEAGIAGEIHYSNTIDGWTTNPDEAINLVSVHDGATLWDNINAGIIARASSQSDRIRMDELATGIVFTSQGVPYMQGGDEFLRTKGGNANSYNAGDAVNQLAWSRKATYAKVFNYYAGLIHLRRSHPAFHMQTPSDITKHLKFLKTKGAITAFELTGHANKDKWKNITVIYNPNSSKNSVNLPAGKWSVAATAGKIGTKTIGHAAKHVAVPSYSMEVLHQ